MAVAMGPGRGEVALVEVGAALVAPGVVASVGVVVEVLYMVVGTVGALVVEDGHPVIGELADVLCCQGLMWCSVNADHAKFSHLPASCWLWA